MILRTVFISIVFVFIIGYGQKHTVEAIKCYECTSSVDVHCTETMDVRDTNLEPVDCSYLHDAQYCVKTIGIFNGEVGTTRFCSSQNLGQICDFQKRLGDVRSYRSCVYTCSSDFCNSASIFTINTAMLLILLTAVIFICQRI